MIATSSLIIAGMVLTGALSLKCYFCKGDYNSRTEDELKTSDIPFCGKEPYNSPEEHLVPCDIYWDNFGMIYPSFKDASKVERRNTSTNNKKKRRLARQYLNNGSVEERNEKIAKPGGNYQSKGSRKNLKYGNVYPYNLTNMPWGTQRLHERVSPYYCLTVHTINSTFPSRVCGLRYFIDCPLLIELTSEPLQPSSFIKSCQQCTDNFCNAAQFPTASFSYQVLLFLFHVIHSYFCS